MFDWIRHLVRHEPKPVTAGVILPCPNCGSPVVLPMRLNVTIKTRCTICGAEGEIEFHKSTAEEIALREAEAIVRGDDE